MTNEALIKRFIQEVARDFKVDVNKLTYSKTSACAQWEHLKLFQYDTSGEYVSKLDAPLRAPREKSVNNSLSENQIIKLDKELEDYILAKPRELAKYLNRHLVKIVCKMLR